jgi:hypothetical protein
MKRAISAAVILTLLAGCATMNPETKSAGEGAAIGAVGGFLVCTLAGGRSDTCAAVAAATGVAGAAIGYGLAKNIQNRRKQLEGQEDNLDARIRYARGVNEDSAAFNKQLKVRLDTVTKQVETKKVSQQQQEQERKQLDDELKKVSFQVAVMENALKELEQFKAQKAAKISNEAERQKSEALDAEIAHLQRLVEEARSNTTAMASLRQSI